ncbi:hypothetical protein K1T71_011337 [Dendrolimus kikuchii]|uniref:Uncharacterized protein n=1 Tax=Dendrolimus kikuchii TaxID=765133 RepID=A0ACC1CNJ5_9NEOP|nr:hypothetical protein K1T71_011337 [Dendrolimus kikuchii]
MDWPTFLLRMMFALQTAKNSMKAFAQWSLGFIGAKTTVIVDGNTVTQVSKFPDGKILTFKGEYSGDDLVITLTNSKWDGVAKRYYKA